MTTQRWRGYLLVVAAVTLFGAAGALARYLFLSGVTPEQLVQLRLATATLGLWAVVLLTRRPPARLRRHDLGPALLFGISLLLVMYTYYLAVSRIGVAPSILLQDTNPVLIMLYAAVVLRERSPRLAPLAAGLALLGSALTVRAYDPAQLRLDAAGVAAGLASAACAAGYILAGRSVQRQWGTVPAMAAGFTIAAVLSALIQWPGAVLSLAGRPDLLAGGLAVGVFGTLIPFGLIVRSTRHILPAETAILGSLEAVAGGAVAALWLGEGLEVGQLLGGALILAGVGTLTLSGQRSAVSPQRSTVS